MNPDHHSAADAVGRFRTTQWSVVLSAHSNVPGSEAALGETIFDARWAMTVMGRLRREYVAGGKISTLETLEPFLDPNKEPPSYEQVASELQISLSAVKTLIHRLRKQYTGLLREEVGRTLSDPGEIDEEIHALCGALVASEGRLSP